MVASRRVVFPVLTTKPHPRLWVLCDADPDKAACTMITTTTSPDPEALTPILFVGPPAGWRLQAKPHTDSLTGLAGGLKKLAEKGAKQGK
ncbi:hypothetical protein N7467_002929 [Penicillium canescens]|nr:hypothetical protein N7467_002929 [Penicillium canescens]